MNQDVSPRVQQALEQIGENESLTSDLTDAAATALLEWIAQQVQAADAAPDDESFRLRVAAIRSAARKAAQCTAGEDMSGVLVVERAQGAHESAAPRSAAPAQPTPTIAPPPAVEAASPATPQAAAQAQAPDSALVPDHRQSVAPRQNSVWNSLRRRVRRWVHRKG